MPLLQVRDFPGDVYGEIAFEAHRQGRTLAQQTIVLVKKGLGEDMSNMERRRLAVERTLAREVPQAAKAMDFVGFVREDRGR